MKDNAKQLIEKIQVRIPRLIDLRNGSIIIQGIKPTLADVLECFSRDIEEIFINLTTIDILICVNRYKRINVIWDLSEPIENQSDELINCLLDI